MRRCTNSDLFISLQNNLARWCNVTSIAHTQREREEICSQAAGSAAGRCGRHICGRRWGTWVIKLLLKSVRRRGKKCCSTSVWSKWPLCNIRANVSKAIKCMIFLLQPIHELHRKQSSPSFTSRACSTSQKVFVLKHPVLAGSRKNG